MKRLSLALMGLVACCLLATADTAHAQSFDRLETGRFGGRRPTLSPYLGLFRRDNGVLPNYHMFVRPRLRLDNTLNYQQGAIYGLERETIQLEQAIPGTTGTQGAPPRFQNYLHYYPMGPGVRR